MHGRRALTDLYYTRKGDKHEIMVCPARGSYTGQLESRSYTIEVAGTRRAESAEFNEKPVAVEYDARLAVNRVRVSERSIRRGVKVRVVAAESR